MVGDQVSGIDRFCSQFSSVVCSIDCDAEDGESSFQTNFSRVALGPVEIFKYDGDNLRFLRREQDHICSDGVDDFLACLPVVVPFEVFQSEHRAVIEPGNFIVLSTQQPFMAVNEVPKRGHHTQYVVRIPGGQMRRQVADIDRCCATPISACSGASRVTWGLIQSLFVESEHLSLLQRQMYGSIILTSLGIATIEAPEIRSTPRSRRQVAHARIRVKAQAFIEANLNAPELDAAMVASHCYVSLRHLYAAFEASSETVAAAIREARLCRAREDLRNPKLRSMSIMKIAMKWGFGSSPAFCRVYQKHYGIPPSEERV